MKHPRAATSAKEGDEVGEKEASEPAHGTEHHRMCIQFRRPPNRWESLRWKRNGKLLKYANGEPCGTHFSTANEMEMPSDH